MGGAWGCATGGDTPSNGTRSGHTRSGVEHRETARNAMQAGEAVRGDTEQVVQRIVPAPNRSAANGVRPAADTAVPSPKSSVEPITPKHLEAELNRLEAELGR
jgi:hypothetical protein